LSIDKLDKNIEKTISKIVISLFIVISLVLAGFLPLPIFGDSEGEPENIQQIGFKIGKILYVGSGQIYSKIQDAYDNASAGDIIQIYSGTYFENLVVDKTLTLIGSGMENTIILEQRVSRRHCK